jgi:hypothetical protein
MGRSMFEAKQKRQKITSVYLDRPPEEPESEEQQPRGSAYYITVVLLLFAGIPISFMLLWNWLMPAIFGLPAIGYFKSIGLLILSLYIFRR